MKRLFEHRVFITIGTAAVVFAGIFSATAQEVKIIRGPSPAQSIPQPGASAQPAPLSGVAKLQAVQSVVNRRGKKAGSFVNPVVLRPGKLKAGSAMLLLLEPSYVQAFSVEQAAFFKPLGRAIVYFTPPSAGHYLIDFTVTGFGPFTLSGKEDTHSATGPGLDGHLLFVINAEANKVVDLALGGKGWTFYSCEISQIKYAGS